MLISDKRNENEVNDEEDKSDRAKHSEFRKTEEELIFKSICKTLKST